METLKEIKLLKPENRFDSYMEQKENIYAMKMDNQTPIDKDAIMITM